MGIASLLRQLSFSTGSLVPTVCHLVQHCSIRNMDVFHLAGGHASLASMVRAWATSLLCKVNAGHFVVYQAVPSTPLHYAAAEHMGLYRALFEATYEVCSPRALICWDCSFGARAKEGVFELALFEEHRLCLPAKLPNYSLS